MADKKISDLTEVLAAGVTSPGTAKLPIELSGALLTNFITASELGTLLGQHAAVTAGNVSIALSGQALSVAIDGGANNRLSLAGGGLRVDAAATSHTHAIADTTGLQTALDGKSATGHTHAAADIASGTIATARLGSGTASASTFLRGDQTWATVSGGISDGTYGQIVVSGGGTSMALASTATPAVESMTAKTFAGGETSAREWSLGTRSALTDIPVPYFRAKTANKNTVLDIMPNGVATDYFGNGICWIDVCDTDCAAGNPPIRAARVGITANNAEFGSVSFNGASVLPTVLAVNRTAKIRAQSSLVELLDSTSIAHSLTGSASTSLLDMAATWNTTGTPSAIKLNVTDTASNASSKLLDLQVGGVTKSYVAKSGAVFVPDGSSSAPGIGFASETNSGLYRSASNTLNITVGGTRTFVITSSSLGMQNGSSISFYSAGFATTDAMITRDDTAGAIAQRMSTTAQSMRVYNTWTSATNYERGVIDWQTTANTLRIGTEKGSGGGTARSLVLVTDATARVTVSSAGQVTFAGDNVIVATSKTPSSAADTGTTGMVCWDSSYLYVCTATNTWKRAAIATW